MAHKTQFKHKACGTELHMDADLEDRFYSDPTAIVKLYCPTCKSLFAVSGFAWVDNDLPVEPGHPDNELPDGEEEPPVPDNSLPVGPGDGPSNELPPVEGPVDPGYGVGSERPDQGLPPGRPGGIVDNELPEPNPNPNPDIDVDIDRGARPDQGQPKPEPKKR